MTPLICAASIFEREVEMSGVPRAAVRKLAFDPDFVELRFEGIADARRQLAHRHRAPRRDRPVIDGGSADAVGPTRRRRARVTPLSRGRWRAGVQRGLRPSGLPRTGGAVTRGSTLVVGGLLGMVAGGGGCPLDRRLRLNRGLVDGRRRLQTEDRRGCAMRITCEGQQLVEAVAQTLDVGSDVRSVRRPR